MRYLIAALLVFATPALAEDIGNNTVCFVPGPDDCAMIAAAEIEKATKTLSMQAYQYTEPHIAQAVLDAKARGVTVRLIVDKTAVNERNGETQQMVAAGIPVWVDYHPHIAHNKVIVIDDAVTIGGSLNYSINADTKNAENMTVIRDSGWAHAFTDNLDNRLQVSETLSEYEQRHLK